MKAAYCISRAAVVVLNTSDITILIYNLHYGRGKGLNIGCNELANRHCCFYELQIINCIERYNFVSSML